MTTNRKDSGLPDAYQEILKANGFATLLSGAGAGGEADSLEVFTPIDGSRLGAVPVQSAADVDVMVGKAAAAFTQWRAVPAPVRGGFVRLLGEELRLAKDDLGRLVSLECGKVLSEGLGEVQEMIDICDFAVGLSRQLYGLTMPSERPGHHMRESWQPLGPVGVITAFNFPVAVWAWNAAIALVCGDPVIWKPSEKTPLTALACARIADKAVARFAVEYATECGDILSDLLQLAIGGRAVGEALSAHPGVKLVSATGSVPMGRAVGETVAARMGRSLLELGGNNAMIVAPSADLAMALRAILFSAVGTAGQRCTTLRRLIVHQDIAADLSEKLVRTCEKITIGDPLAEGVLLGPLIDEDACHAMEKALKAAQEQGGTVLCGGGRATVDARLAGGFYVRPAIVEMPAQTQIVCNETFAPILYILRYTDLDEAVALNNAVPQGLSSCIFTTDMREAERFLSAAGSDCGIANVNIGPSGAEIGGAFGGEKETGGGRESGSDSWKAYMRRQTQTVNYSAALPLAQGVVFDV